MKQHRTESTRKPRWTDECLMLFVVGLSAASVFIVSKLGIFSSRWVADGIGIFLFAIGCIAMRRWRGWP